jgi:hypothetical protein
LNFFQTDQELREAIEDLRMGLRLTELYREKRQKYLGIEDSKEFSKAWARLSHEERDKLEAKALDFVEAVCRRLGETSGGDQRIALLLVEWADRSKEYAPFDVLLTEFGDFEQRARILRQGLRLFPSTLTAHW